MRARSINRPLVTQENGRPLRARRGTFARLLSAGSRNEALRSMWDRASPSATTLWVVTQPLGSWQHHTLDFRDDVTARSPRRWPPVSGVLIPRTATLLPRWPLAEIVTGGGAARGCSMWSCQRSSRSLRSVLRIQRCARSLSLAIYRSGKELRPSLHNSSMCRLSSVATRRSWCSTTPT